MANAWFRMYGEFANDPKVQMLSEVLQRRYIMLLCMRCNGHVTLHDDEVAFQLRISNEEWTATKATLVAKGLIGLDSCPAAWDKRQYASDSSAMRVAKHRKKKEDACNGDVTLHLTNGNALDTDTDTEEEAKASLSGSANLTEVDQKPIPLTPCPFDDLIDTYEKNLSAMPRVRRSLFKTGKNGTALRQRWAWVMSSRHEGGVRKGERLAETPEQGVDWFDRYFGFVAGSDFLTKKFAACDLAWLVAKENFENVLSGRYENRDGVVA